MEIRLALREDLPSINGIYNQAVEEKFCTAHLAPVSMDDRMEWFGLHDTGRFPVYVSTEGRVVTGWISLGPYRTDRQALAHVAEVSFYVKAGYREKGVGSRLLEYVIGVAPRFSLEILVAILLDRNGASIALLKKFGFAEWGRMPGIARIGREQIDHLYFGLKLIPE